MSEHGTPVSDIPHVVNEHEAAAYIGLSVSFLRKARAGRGSPGPTYVRVSSRAIRYRVSDLNRWLDARAVRGDDV